MKYNNVTKPYGMTSLCAEIENVCCNAHKYKKCGSKPEHLVVCLDSGSGRTTFLEYMTDMYKKSGVVGFTGGLDDYLEISFDGTLKQMKQAFDEIESAAVYDNSYKGIIGMDISGFSQHMNEVQFNDFLSGCKRVCKNATAVFFVHSELSANEEKLVTKLCESIENIKRIKAEPYTSESIVRIICGILSERGVFIKQSDAFNTVMKRLVKSFGISDIKSALEFADILIEYADFSGFMPEIGKKSLNEIQSKLDDSKGVMTNEQR